MKKKATKQQISASWRRVGAGPQAPGERKREGSEALRCRRYRKKLGKAEIGKNLTLSFRTLVPGGAAD